ncbi:MAG: signal peptidase I [Glaciecola sp.]
MANYFSIFLVLISLITGIVWLVYALVFAPKKDALVMADDSSTEAPIGSKTSEQAALNSATEMPAWVDFCKQMFPIFFGVMVFRSFIYEPFQIPSGSMFPTLLVGDFLLVEKFAYSLKDPVARKELVNTGDVKRGDVVVFKYPDDPRIDYIKRVVGLPGETVIYQNKQIFIQSPCGGDVACEPAKPVSLKSLGKANSAEHGAAYNLFSEQLGDVEHQILRNPNADRRRPGKYVIPEGHYMVFGDNRDNSLDSRAWGYVPEENIVGKAVFVWMSFEFEREPDDFLPSFIPTGVRFERIGTIE